jgi:hypothetical protein
MELEWLPVPVPDVPEAAPGISINRLLCLGCPDPDPVVDTDELLPVVVVVPVGGRQPTEKARHANAEWTDGLIPNAGVSKLSSGSSRSSSFNRSLEKVGIGAGVVEDVESIFDSV